MRFYISPENRETCEKKIARMCKKLTNKPTVSFSDVQQVVKNTTVNWFNESITTEKEIINAVLVEIEGLDVNEWRVVAEVDYYNQQLLLCDAESFKDIPSKYGLTYHKCDHCGGVNEYRKTSFIMRHKVTGEWCQVGSSCVSKMVNGGKYLADIIVQLHNYIKVSDGCGDDEWYGGGWRPSEKWRRAAIEFTDAIRHCKNYYDYYGGNVVWQKPEYDEGIKVKCGTNETLVLWYRNTESEECDEEIRKMIRTFNAEVNDEYIEKVRNHVETLDSGNEFNKKMQDAFVNEYIQQGDMYLAWFAMKSYEDSITAGDFLKQTENIKVGDKIALRCKLTHIEFVKSEDYYMSSYWYSEFEDESGLHYSKTFSSLETLGKYLTEKVNTDDMYMNDYIGKDFAFTANVGFINARKQTIKLQGRLSKYNKK